MILIQPGRLFAVFAALLAHVQPAVPPGPFGRAARRPGSAQPVSLQGVCPPQVWGFLLVLVGFHEVPVGPFPWPVLVPLDGSPALWRTSCTPWFVLIHILDFKTKLSLS